MISTRCRPSAPAAASRSPREHAGTVAELTVNRRQRAEWEQAALAALRNGSVATAVGAYRDHDRGRRHRGRRLDDR